MIWSLIKTGVLIVGRVLGIVEREQEKAERAEYRDHGRARERAERSAEELDRAEANKRNQHYTDRLDDERRRKLRSRYYRGSKDN